MAHTQDGARLPAPLHLHLVRIESPCSCASCERLRLYDRAVRASVGATVGQYGWPVLGALIADGSLPWEAAAEVVRRPPPAWGVSRWRAARMAVEAMGRGEALGAAGALAFPEGLTVEAWIDRAMEPAGILRVVESTGEVVS